MPVNHFIRQVEIHRSNRNKRDVRPGWLTRFIEATADLFEPVDDSARVGFDCQPAEGRWNVAMYLGGTEIVGGPSDGLVRPARFHFDARRLLERFTSIDALVWTTSPGSPDEDNSQTSYLTVEGRVGEHSLHLEIHSVARDEAGPAFRTYPDGRRTPA